MKVWQKISVFLAMLVLCFGMINMPVSAATNTQDGLKVTLTTDKDMYSQSDEIKVNISVENTNSFDVNNVSLESIIPDGLELKKDYSSSATIGNLATGDSYKCELVLQKSEESVPVEDGENADSEDLGEGTSTTENQSSQTSTSIDKNSINQNEKANESDSVQTGDFTSIIPVSIVFVVSAAIIIFLLYKKRNRIFLFFLGIVGSALLFNNGVIDSKAAETVNQRNISVNEIIQVGDNKYELQVNVNYEWVNNQDVEDSEIIQLTIDQSDFTTEEKEVTLSGSYTGNVAEITYENVPGDEYYGEISNGNVSFSDNKWYLDLSNLSTGENNIIITASDNSGKSVTASVKVTLEGLYEYSQDDIVTDVETGISYVKNVILIFFEKGVDDSIRKEIIDSVSGKIIGEDSFIEEVFIRVPETEYEDLTNIAKQLETIDGVLAASIDIASQMSTTSEGVYPSDGVSSYRDKALWYDEINASVLSEYQNNTIDVGIIDVGFDYWHEDLRLINVSDVASIQEKDHGTHVAGIIGAKNNAFGINGILKNCNLYCYDAKPESYQSKFMYTGSATVYGMIRCVEKGAKIINYSMTTNDPKNEDFTPEQKKESGEYYSKYIYALRNSGKDFLIIQAAGNGHIEGKLQLGRDASNTGAFACITEENCYRGDSVSIEEILDSIIIVASAEKTESGYQLMIESNGGEQVDITAPGQNIFSTIENGYGYMSGTSQATPMVTGAAAGIWSMAPSLSAKEIKNIILNSADLIVASNPDAPNAADNGQTSYSLLNIERAVNYTLDARVGTISGKVVQENQSPLEYVSVEIYAENGDKVESGYTDKSGMFTFDLTEGTYEIHFAKSGFDNKEMSINISHGAITALLDPIVMNAKSVGIQGTVVDETGNAISDVNVEIKDSNSDEDITITTTDGNGEFFVTLENGEYKITFTKEGYESVTRDNIIVFDGTNEIGNIVMNLSRLNDNFVTEISPPDESATLIYTVEDLLNATEGNYVLANDLDLGTYNNGVWIPINVTGNLTLDGQGHVIKNMNVVEESESYRSGLYGTCSNYSCTFKNIGLDNVNINNPLSAYSGGLIGYVNNGVETGDNAETNKQSIIVNNCYIDGVILQSIHAGGLLGYIYNSAWNDSYQIDVQILNSYSKANIISENSSGGIIGYVYGTSNNNIADAGELKLEIDNCHNYGTITATEYDNTSLVGYESVAGGIIGFFGTDNVMAYVDVKNSSSSNNIESMCSGGIIGYIEFGRNVTINNCKTDGSIEGYSIAGGIIADAGLSSDATTTTVESCLVSGTVKASSYIGGIIGNGSRYTNINGCKMDGIIEKASMYGTVGGILGSDGYSTTIYDSDMLGKFNIMGENTSGTLYLGGIVGSLSGTSEIGNCNFKGEINVTASEKNVVGGIIGITNSDTTIAEKCTYILIEDGVGKANSDIINNEWIIKLD